MVPSEARGGIKFPGAGVINVYCQHGCWDSNLRPLEEQKVLLATESSL